MKYFTTLFCFFISYLSFGQSFDKLTSIDFRIDNSLKTNEYSMVFKWSLTKNEFAKDVVLEILPIEDCFRYEEAKEFKESLFYNLNSISAERKGKLELIHKELMVKCFKYRLIYFEDNKKLKTNWNYYSFVN